jgi:uncharacterized protein (TIGR03067 family)
MRRWMMRWSLVAVAILSLACSTSSSQQKDNAKGESSEPDDLKALQGAWEEDNPKATTKDGKPSPLSLQIKDKRFVIYENKTKLFFEATVVIDSKKDPKSIDLKVIRGGDNREIEGKTMHGVYELREGTLRMTFGKDIEKRPSKLGQTKEDGLIVYKRLGQKR